MNRVVVLLVVLSSHVDDCWPQVSVVAMQSGEHLKSYKTRSGDRLEFLYLEDLSAQVGRLVMHPLRFFSCSVIVKKLFTAAVSSCEAFQLSTVILLIHFVPRKYLRRSTSPIPWRLGGWGLLAGLLCALVSVCPHAFFTHWVSICCYGRQTEPYPIGFRMRLLICPVFSPQWIGSLLSESLFPWGWNYLPSASPARSPFSSLQVVGYSIGP